MGQAMIERGASDIWLSSERAEVVALKVVVEGEIVREDHLTSCEQAH